VSDFDLREYLDLQRRHALLNEKLRVAVEMKDKAADIAMALGFEHNQMVEKLRVAVEGLLPISCCENCGGCRDNAISLLTKIKGGSDE
jgi:hypothetical protein